MATYSEHIRITKEKIITLPLPSNFTELEKAMAGVRQALTSFSIKYYDDTVTITMDDESLLFSFEITDPE